MRKKLRSFTYYPTLLIIFIILSLWSRNFDRFKFYDILFPLFISISLFNLLFFILKRFFENSHIRAVVLSFVIFWFFGYTFIISLMERFIISQFISIPIWTISIILICSFIITKLSQKSFNFSKVTLVANIFISTLLSIVCINLVLFESNVYKLIQKDDWVPLSTNDKEVKTFPKGSLPDIYYIILDAHVGSDVLKKSWDYDEHDFVNWLIKKGFYIDPNSKSNYSCTVLSILSSLNMSYLDDFKKLPRYDNRDQTSFYYYIKNNKVKKVLESNGYSFIDLAWANWAMDNKIKIIDFTEFGFLTSLLNRSVISVIMHKIVLPLSKRYEILNKIEKLENTIKIKGPKFIYAHFMIPHEEFVFDQNGNSVSIFKNRKNLKNYYLEQLIYTDKIIKKAIDRIMTESDIKPIIIIQGDHGWSGIEGESHIKTNMSILNAYYLPNKSSNILYKGITPVNSFRIIFNTYFGMNLNLFEDKSYYSPFPDNYLNYVEVK